MGGLWFDPPTNPKYFFERILCHSSYSIFNRGDNLKEKQAYKKIWALPVKNFSLEFLPLTCLFLCKTNFIPISIWFCVIALQIYREILKKYRKRAITLQKNNFFKNLRKPFLDIHIRNVMPKFESSMLNGVAVIAKTHTQTYKQTYTHTHTHTSCRT